MAFDLAERYDSLRDDPTQGEFAQSVEAWVRSYTRGVGFDTNSKPFPALRGVILAAAKRLSMSPVASQSTDGSEVRYVSFQGFNLAEQMVLNDYRKRSA